MRFERYGLSWQDGTDAAWIEREMLKNGGKWISDSGREYGNGLEFHFKEFWKHLWPDDSQTRWTDLILHEVLSNQFTSIAGPGSSWKSGSVARIALMDWSLFPECTTVMISSTTMTDLKNRIFGEVIKMWKEASERFPWFPGHSVDSKCVITAEDIEEEQARDIRNSIVGVACKTSAGRFQGMGCFCPGTLVDTPIGPRPIEQIQAGDVVWSAIGASRVRATSSHYAPKIVRLHLSDGTHIDCTPEHPFLTKESGWVNADLLSPHHAILSTDETLRILREGTESRQTTAELLRLYLSASSETKREALSCLWGRDSIRGQALLQRDVHEVNYEEELHRLWSGIYPERSPGNFLFSVLQREVEIDSAGYCPEGQGSACQERLGSNWQKGECQHSWKSSGNETASNSRKDFEPRWLEKIRHENENIRRKYFALDIPRSHSQFQGCNREIVQAWASLLLQNRFGMAGYSFGGGSGWELSRKASSDVQGLGARFVPCKTRVVRVEIPQQAGDSRYNESQGGYRVHNLEVEGHPSFSVANCVVHNSFVGRKNRRVWCIGDEFQFMERSILDAQNNLISNGPNLIPGIIRDKDAIERGKPLRGYKCVFVGNPNPTRPDNPLHLVSEPEGGWGSIPEDGKTKVWNCRKLQDHPVKCRCINLDGADSPNNDFPGPTPRWLHLAGAHTIGKYTEGTEAYYSQGRGIFKFGLAKFKVITKEVCDQFHAFDPLIWNNKGTTKIGMLDAAYGGVGGDRCPVRVLEFGECNDGKIRILFHPHQLIVVTARNDMIPEDQIAMQVKDKMEGLDVPPENFFFDGRGSLAMSLARVWSPKVNSLEFGGRPSDRQIDGQYIKDGSGAQRLKVAHEHYSKFVSELWWSLRYAIEADQIRGLDLETVLDATPREWRKVAGDKIEIETKKDMKKRTGCSPDLADCAVVGLEGARRRGFKISKLANEVEAESDRSWWEDIARKRNRQLKQGQLNYAA